MELDQVVALMRARGLELEDVEVKRAAKGLPQSLPETMSAFANTGGGLVILGLDEKDGFAAVGVPDPAALRDAVVQAAREKITPPLRPSVDVTEIDDRPVVTAEVGELPAAEKPCYVTARGRYGGAYVRCGDGDHRLTAYEVDRLTENNAQPRWDREPVPNARPGDLDPDAVRQLIVSATHSSPRAFTGLSDEDVLLRLGMLVDHGGQPVPSLTGLLALGLFPQQYFPQLLVTVTVYPCSERGRPGPGGERFLDTAVCQGPIPQMVDGALHAVGRNLRTASVIRGSGRIDLPEIRPEVVREVVANALMHRDYSPGARGSQVQVELFPDRLEVHSPGGLFGNVTEADLGIGGVSSSRNALLAARLMEVADPATRRPVAENRGSGLAMVVSQLLADADDLPQFRAGLDTFTVSVPRQPAGAVDGDADALRLPEGRPLSHAQRIVLRAAARGVNVDTASFRRQGLAPAQALAGLRELEALGLIEPSRARGRAQYRATPGLLQRLSGSADAPAVPASGLGDLAQRVLTALGRRADLSRAELEAATGSTRVQLTDELNALLRAGLIEATAPPRSPKRRYRLADG